MFFCISLYFLFNKFLIYFNMRLLLIFMFSFGSKIMSADNRILQDQLQAKVKDSYKKIEMVIQIVKDKALIGPMLSELATSQCYHCIIWFQGLSSPLLVYLNLQVAETKELQETITLLRQGIDNLSDNIKSDNAAGRNEDTKDSPLKSQVLMQVNSFSTLQQTVM
jgi:hypothetical protein